MLTQILLEYLKKDEFGDEKFKPSFGNDYWQL